VPYRSRATIGLLSTPDPGSWAGAGTSRRWPCSTPSVTTISGFLSSSVKLHGRRTISGKLLALGFVATMRLNPLSTSLSLSSCGAEFSGDDLASYRNSSISCYYLQNMKHRYAVSSDNMSVADGKEFSEQFTLVFLLLLLVLFTQMHHHHRTASGSTRDCRT